jgi:hypothetical protein
MTQQALKSICKLQLKNKGRALCSLVLRLQCVVQLLQLSKLRLILHT